MVKKLFIACFLSIVFGLGLLLLTLPKTVYSDDENRYLAAFPTVSWDALQSGKLMEELEQFIDDQFPFRLTWIGIKGSIELALGKQEVNGVYVTDDGFYIESFKQLDEAQLAKNVEALNTFAALLDAQFQLPLHVMLVPTAAAILTDKLPASHMELDQLAHMDALSEQAFELITVGDTLRTHAQEPIYYKTDHHWTSLGAYYSYAAWQPETQPLAAYTEEVLTTDFWGTLYSKIKMKRTTPDTMHAYYVEAPQSVEYNLDGQQHDSFYTRSFLTKKDKYSVYFNGNQPVTRIQGYGEGKLLLVKDSYANTFAQFAVADFAEVHLIDLRSFNMPLSQYIDMMDIDEVLVLYNFKNFTEDNHLYMLR